MGDRLLRIQDDFETMQRLMNELEYEKKQYEKEIEKEMQLTAELKSKTEADKQEDKLNTEAVKQQNEETILLDKQCIQERHNYSSLQEACDILSEQEKNLSRSLRQLKISDEAARENKKATVDRYGAIYKSYQEKYEKHPLAVRRREKEGELANWKVNFNEAKLMAEETAKKLATITSPSVSEFPVFRNQNEFIIRLAEMKLTFDELFTELGRKTDCYEELKKTTGEKAKARKQMEEEKKKDDLKRIAEERASDARNTDEKRMKADIQRQEERKQHSGEQRRTAEAGQMEEQRLRLQMQNISLQAPFRKDAFRPEMTTASQPPVLQPSTAFHQRLPPKIFMPARQMSLQPKEINEKGVFRVPLPPKDLRHPLTAAAGKRLQHVDSPIATRTLPPCSEASPTITRPRLYPDAPVVRTTAPVQPQQPSCTEPSSGVIVPPQQAPCPEAGITILPPETGGGLTTCLKNLSIHGHGQTDRIVLMETEDETFPAGFNFSSLPHEDSTSTLLSGFNPCSDVGAGEDPENSMLSCAPVEEQEATCLKATQEHCLDGVGPETSMSTDEEELFRSFEAAASAADSVSPEVSVNISDARSSYQHQQVNSDICNSVMRDDPVSHNSTSIADCVVASSFARSVCLPLDIPSSPGSLVAEAVASDDHPTLTATTTLSTSEVTTMPSQVSWATPAVAPHHYPSASMSAAEPEFGAEESGASDFSMSLEQSSGWAIGGTKTPAIRIAEDAADTGKFVGSASPVMEFNFEDEMAKLRKLSQSPAVSLYSQRRMFTQSDQSEGQSVGESDGMTNFMCNFESARQSKDSDKAANPDFRFGGMFSFSGQSDSNEIFNFFGSRGNEAESSSKSGKDGASTSDDIFRLFGGSDAESAAASRQKDTVSDASTDIFSMFSNSGSTTTSSKNKGDDASGGFFNFGAKPANDAPAKSQFKFF